MKSHGRIGAVRKQVRHRAGRKALKSVSLCALSRRSSMLLSPNAKVWS